MSLKSKLFIVGGDFMREWRWVAGGDEATTWSLHPGAEVLFLICREHLLTLCWITVQDEEEIYVQDEQE